MNDSSLPVSSNHGWSSMVRPVLASAVLFMLVTGLAYPLATTGVAQVLFSPQANGSLVRHANAVIGSALIGQDFRRAEYFHPRPSVTSAPDPAHPDQTVDSPYNAALGAGSNLGPTSKKLIDQARARALAYRQENSLPADAAVPVDAVTASASGLDPDISLANARLQTARIAKARGLQTDDVLALLARQTTPRQLSVLGEARINVLQLNLALDALANGHRASL